MKEKNEAFYYEGLLKEIDSLKEGGVTSERRKILKPLIHYIQEKTNSGACIRLNFICTHNSRRSQFAQVWAQTLATYFDIHLESYSAGTLTTAVFPKVVEILRLFGFGVNKFGKGENPQYFLKFGPSQNPIIIFSKDLAHPYNPQSDFAAIMTCTDADQGCPFVPGAEARFAVPYEDPKISDGTSQQTEQYIVRNRQIASELFYVFSQIKLNEGN